MPSTVSPALAFLSKLMVQLVVVLFVTHTDVSHDGVASTPYLVSTSVRGNVTVTENAPAVTGCAKILPADVKKRRCRASQMAACRASVVATGVLVVLSVGAVIYTLGFCGTSTHDVVASSHAYPLPSVGIGFGIGVGFDPISGEVAVMRLLVGAWFRSQVSTPSS